MGKSHGKQKGAKDALRTVVTCGVQKAIDTNLLVCSIADSPFRIIQVGIAILFSPRQLHFVPRFVYALLSVDTERGKYDGVRI